MLGCPPRLFELEHFSRLLPHMEFEQLFSKPEYRGWVSMRNIDDSRFVGMVLPRVLMRLPYRCDGSRADGFIYDESIAAHGRRRLRVGQRRLRLRRRRRPLLRDLWLARRPARRPYRRHRRRPGRPPARSVLRHRPPGRRTALAARGGDRRAPRARVRRARLHPDLAARLHAPTSSSTAISRCTSPSATIAPPAAPTRGSRRCCSRSSAPRASPTISRSSCATRSAASRPPEEIEKQLERWLAQYCDIGDNASEEKKARYPLREAKVQVSEVPGKPGSYNGKFFLRPQFQLDEMSGSISLTTAIQVQQAS